MTDEDKAVPPLHILDALERIVSSEHFRQAERNRAFLTYIVQETIDGRADRIKAYSIGLEVFGRTSDFDAVHDPIVRTAAHRLRTALVKYYDGAGKDDAVIISLPKGSYVPEFRWRETLRERRGVIADRRKSHVPGEEAAPTRAGVWRPPFDIQKYFTRLTLLLLALSGIYTIWSCLQLTAKDVPNTTIIVQQVEAASTRPEIGVLARAATGRLVARLSEYGGPDIIDISETQNSPDVINRLLAQASPLEDIYLLASTIGPRGDCLSIIWRLIDVRSQRVAWVSEAAIPNTPGGMSDAIVAQITNSLLGTEGAIPVLQSQIPGSSADSRKCLSQSQRRALSYDDMLQSDSQSCLEKLAATHSNDPQVWALLSLAYYWASRTAASLGKDPVPLEAKQRATAAYAESMAPQSYFTLQARMFVAYTDGQFDVFSQISQELLKRFGGDPTLKLRIGHALAALGNFDEALPLVEQANEGTNATSGMGYMILAYQKYTIGDYQNALQLLDRVGVSNYYMVPLMRAASYGQLGESKLAVAAWDELLALRPNYGDNFYRDFVHKKVTRRYIDLIADGLHKAGIGVTVPLPLVDSAEPTAMPPIAKGGAQAR